MRELIGAIVLMSAVTEVSAGGVEATGDGRILLLDGEKGLFLASSDATIRLNVDLPINGASFLEEQIGEGDFGDIFDATDQLRYSDVLLAREGDSSAIVVAYAEYHIDENCFTSTLAKFTMPAPQALEDVKISSDDWVDVARDACLEPFEDGLPVYGLRAGGRLAQMKGDTERVIWTIGDAAEVEVYQVNLSDGDYDVIARDRN